MYHWSHGSSSPQAVFHWNGAERPCGPVWNSGLVWRPDVRPGPSLHYGAGPPDTEAALLEHPPERIACDQKRRLMSERLGRDLRQKWQLDGRTVTVGLIMTGDNTSWFHDMTVVSVLAGRVLH